MESYSGIPATLSSAKENKIKIFKNFYFPISITKITNKEQIKKIQNHTLNEAIEIGVEKLSKQIEEKIENKQNIKNKKVETEEGENLVIVNLIYEVLENIGKYEKIEK